MGLGIVLLFWLVVGGLAAAIGAVLLAGVVARITRDAKSGRRRLLIILALLFPFLCFGWMGAIFAGQGLINTVWLDRDPGIGDSWSTPLPNGYVLLMIDETDRGTIYNPKTLPPDIIASQGDNVFDVTDLQLEGRYMLGRFNAAEKPDAAAIWQYFLLDTRTGNRRIFPDWANLNTAAAPLGIRPKFEPIAEVYSRYRFTWFDWAALLLSFSAPLAGFIWLIREVLRLRSSRAVA